MSKLNATLTLSQLAEARTLWLKGYSLRTLTKRYHVTHNTLYNKLKRVYGANVCNRRVNSLVRSLIRDGLDVETALKLPQGTQWVSSIKQDNTYSKEKMLDFTFACEHIEYNQPEKDYIYNLNLFVMLFDSVVTILDRLNKVEVDYTLLA